MHALSPKKMSCRLFSLCAQVAYYTKDGNTTAVLCATAAAASNALAKIVVDASEAAIKEKGEVPSSTFLS